MVRKPRGIRIEVPSCRKTEGREKGGTLAPNPHQEGCALTAGTDLIYELAVQDALSWLPHSAYFASPYMHSMSKRERPHGSLQP